MILLKSIQGFDLTVVYKWHTYLQKVSKTPFVQGRSGAGRKCYSCDNKSVKSSSCELGSSVDGRNPCDEDFSNKIIKWAVENNISYCTFSQLLKVLYDYGLRDLPKNSRALLKAKEAEFKVSAVPPGSYIHFGLEKNLKNLVTNLKSKNVFSQTQINISIFIDNLPLSNITQQGLWVILGSIVGFTNVIFLIGAYRGYSKPKNSNLFLSEFVEEAKNLCIYGLEVNEIIYNVKIKRLICDAPAKAYILNVKNFGGYSSCIKCNAAGEYKNKSISFEENSTPRTDEDFKKDEIYMSSKTNLLEIPNFGVVSSVPLDYMHLVCLGVVRKLLTIWLSSKEYWVSENSATDIIKSSADVSPCEFQKKSKSLKLFTRWSPNEFRQFLLFYGPVTLKSNLKQVYYDHFLLLHVACRLLCMEVSPKNVDCARELLCTFVKNYTQLYKTERITHNVHGLYHLADDCHSHGTLDSFSSFPFEKFLVKLRSTMKKSRKRSIPQVILKQSYDKIFRNSLKKIKADDFKVFKKLKTNSTDQFHSFSRYERLLLKNAVVIPHMKGNNYVCLKNKKVIEVTDVFEKKEGSNKIYLVGGREFNLVSNFYTDSFDGFELNMFKVEKLSDTVTLWPVEMIDKKCMKITIGNGVSVLVGLLDETF